MPQAQYFHHATVISEVVKRAAAGLWRATPWHGVLWLGAKHALNN